MRICTSTTFDFGNVKYLIRVLFSGDPEFRYTAEWEAAGRAGGKIGYNVTSALEADRLAEQAIMKASEAIKNPAL